MGRKTCEEIYVDKIENGIRGLKLKTKTLEESKVEVYLNKLKPINSGLYEDLVLKFNKVNK